MQGQQNINVYCTCSLGWLIASRVGKAEVGVLYTRLVPETCLHYYLYRRGSLEHFDDTARDSLLISVQCACYPLCVCLPFRMT